MNRFGARDLEQFQARLAELRINLEPPVAASSFVAYTDGACLGNPEGPGGWAAAIFASEGDSQWLLFGHLSSTSNNRAEALGVLAALEWVPPRSQLSLHSDSELTVRQLMGAYKVKANTDIWEVIRRTRADKQLELLPEWVRGHAGDPLNELADRLSKLGATRGVIDDLDVAVERPQPTEVDGLNPRTDWEREFVSSVRDQLKRGRSLTPKQQAIVERMRERKT